MGASDNATGWFDLRHYTEGVAEGWPDPDIYRAIVHDLPRCFLDLSFEAQARALGIVPPVTGTRWDALLAGMVEHVAGLHGHPVPDWVEEPARFVRIPWMPLARTPESRLQALGYAPPAFLRHGALPDPRDLDERGGEKFAWFPEP